MKTKERWISYLLWAFGIAWALQLVACWFYSRGDAVTYRLMLVVVMFTPLAGALLSGANVRELGWRPQFKRNWKYILLACVLPMVLTAAGAALYFVLVPAAFDLSGSYMVSMAGEEAIAQMEAQGMTMQLYGLVGAVQAMTFAPFANMIPALGEEVGWRGVLYPELKKRFGTLKGRVLGGVIWGAWHWPVMILAGYEYGEAYWGAPVSGMALFCVICVGLGVLMDWFYEKTDCIWLPALAHGAVNAAGSVPLIYMSSTYADNLLVGPAPIGIVAGLPMLITAAVICLRKKQN